MADTDPTRRSYRDFMSALAALESGLDVPQASAEWAARFAPCVDRLSSTLRRQFEIEERGEFYAELPTRKPRLAERVEACRVEHVELLSGVDEVVTGLRRASSDADRRRIAARAALLVEHVRRHEATETELMHNAELREVGAGG